MSRHSDELLEQQVREARALNDRLERLVEAVERPGQRADVEREVLLELQALDPQRWIFAGEAGLRTMLRAIPGFAGLWESTVPEEYVSAVVERSGREHPMVLCCQPTVLEGCTPVACRGGCGRWFLALPSGVRVFRGEEE